MLFISLRTGSKIITVYAVNDLAEDVGLSSFSMEKPFCAVESGFVYPSISAHQKYVYRYMVIPNN
jgi:hypothetical protein